ncbi:MAG: alpha/beta fold hydrolase [Pseudomonadales bacterium]
MSIVPTVKHRGCNIHYRVSGTGPLLILQQGFFGSHAEWKHFGYVDALKDSFTIAALDGGSSAVAALDFLTLPGDHMSAMKDGVSVLDPALKARLENGALS